MCLSLSLSFFENSSISYSKYYDVRTIIQVDVDGPHKLLYIDLTVW
jgi:hypothetical protein